MNNKKKKLMINNVNIAFILHVKDGTKMINFSCTLFRPVRLVIN